MNAYVACYRSRSLEIRRVVPASDLGSAARSLPDLLPYPGHGADDDPVSLRSLELVGQMFDSKEG